MPIEIRLIRKGPGLIPASQGDDEELRRLPLGRQFKATISSERSPAMNRFYWAMVGFVSAGIGYDKEALSNDLLIAARQADSWTLSNGWVRITPKRISRMDHYEFRKYVSDAIDIILRDYLPDMSKGNLVGEVERMTGVSYEEAQRAPKRKGKI